MVNHFPRPGMIIQVGGKVWIGTYRNFGRTHKSTASQRKKGMSMISGKLAHGIHGTGTVF